MMKTVKISSDFFGKYRNDKQLYENVKPWVIDNIVGIVISIPEIKKNVELTWQGLKNDLNKVHQPYDKKLISFGCIVDLILNSTYIRTEKDKSGRPDIKNVYKFFSSLAIDNVYFDVIIVIKETSKTFLYDHILLKKA